MKVYVPMTADIIHPGHIKFLEAVASRYDDPFVIVGLLTEKALNGYKVPVMSYRDREYIVKSLRVVNKVVPQDSLNPSDNLIKYECAAVASGDGWEKAELEGMKKWLKWCDQKIQNYQLKNGGPAGKPAILDINIKGERRGEKRYSSREIKNKICKNSYSPAAQDLLARTW